MRVRAKVRGIPVRLWSTSSHDFEVGSGVLRLFLLDTVTQSAGSGELKENQAPIISKHVHGHH